MIRTYEDLMQMNKQNLEAATSASKALSKGLEDISKEALAFSTRSMDGAVAASKQISACKTPADFSDLQTRLAKEQWDSVMAQTKKMVDLSTTVMKGAMEPLQARSRVVMESFARV